MHYTYKTFFFFHLKNDISLYLLYGDLILLLLLVTQCAKSHEAQTPGLSIKSLLVPTGLQRQALTGTM